MPKDGEKAPGKEGARYVWDSQKLAWIEAGETPSTGGGVQPSQEAEVEEVTAEEIPAEAIQAEATAGEAPALKWVLEYKGMLLRFGGASIDLVILLLVGVIVGFVARQFVNQLPFWATLVYGILYFVGFWSWRGQTPGLMLIGAKVVRRDGSSPGLGWSLLRYLFYLMPFFGPVVVLANYISSWFVFLLPLVTLAVMALTREKRGVHDFVAGTVVINTRPKVTEPITSEIAESDELDKDKLDTFEQS